jgi:membrane protein required for colicin V production
MGGLPINQLDFIFGLILVILLLRGLYNGFIREIASIVGLIIGLFLASRLYKSVVPLAERFIEDEAYAQIVSYVVVLVGTFLVVLIVLAILRNIFHMTLLGGLDRFAGGVMGLVKGGLLCAIILMIMTAFLPADSESLTKSRIAPQINRVTTSISTFLPRDMRDDIRAKGSYLHEMWNKDWADELRRKHHKEPIK